MMDSVVAWHPAADGRSGSSRPAEITPGRPRAELDDFLANDARATHEHETPEAQPVARFTYDRGRNS
jgi:hypothetical protein